MSESYLQVALYSLNRLYSGIYVYTYSYIYMKTVNEKRGREFEREQSLSKESKIWKERAYEEV